jgi:hypothetical protein
MSTVNSIIDNDSPIKDIAYTGILARDRGLNFEVRTALKNSIFEYLERSNLDNSNFKEAFIQTLETVELNSEEDIQPEYEDVELEEENLESYSSHKSSQIYVDTEIKLNYISTIETTLGVEFDVTEDINDVKTKSIDFTKKILKINGEEVPHFKIRDNTLTRRSWFAGEEGELFSMLISVEPKDKRVQFTVFVPTIVEGVKPSVQTFNYGSELELKDFPIETVELNSEEDIQPEYEDVEFEEENLESYFSKLNKNIMQTTNEQLNKMKELGFTHHGIITRVGLEQINPFDSELPKSFIRFDEDYQKIYVKYLNFRT